MTILTILGAFLAAHWVDVVIAVIFILVLIYLWKIGKKETVKRIIYALVAKAEQAYGSKTGPIKWMDVYSSLPGIIRLLFSYNEIDQFIKDGVAWLKKQLEAKPGSNLLTYADEMKLLTAGSIDETTES